MALDWAKWADFLAPQKRTGVPLAVEIDLVAEDALQTELAERG